MPVETGGIFISYRRAEADQVASRLYKDLSEQFPDRVFYDHERIPAGKLFPVVLREGISNARVFVLLIGAQWFDLFQRDHGTEDVDFVLAEIEAALDDDLLIIPVLLDTAEIPRDAEARLPLRLQGRKLFQRHALTLRSPHYDYDFARLCKAIVEAGVPKRLDYARLATIGVAGVFIAAGVLGGFGLVASQGPNKAEPVRSTNRSDSAERLPLVANGISPTCQQRLAGATVETVYGIASTCEDESIRKLAQELKADPALLLSRIQEVL